MAKLGLKGFSNFGFIPVVTNSASAYSATGEVERLVGAQSCSVDDQRTDFTINGDDGIYDSGSEWTNSTLTVTVAEMTLEQLAALTGATINEESDEMEECTLDAAPDVALTFSALRRDGGYRLYRYYIAKLTKYKVTHNTKGQNSGENQNYELTFLCSPRLVDSKIRATKEVAKGDALSWLDTIPDEPVVEPGA